MKNKKIWIIIAVIAVVTAAISAIVILSDNKDASEETVPEAQSALLTEESTIKNETISSSDAYDSDKGTVEEENNHDDYQSLDFIHLEEGELPPIDID